jgi:hypothetical protein
VNSPRCQEKCVYFDVVSQDVGMCCRYPIPREIHSRYGCGEHDQFKKWYSFHMQNQFRVDVESVKTKAELDLAAKQMKPGAVVAIKKGEPLKIHESLQDVDTSGVQTKEETGEPIKAAATMPALGTEICAECNEVIVNQTCRCGRIH